MTRRENMLDGIEGIFGLIDTLFWGFVILAAGFCLAVVGCLIALGIWIFG